MQQQLSRPRTSLDLSRRPRYDHTNADMGYGATNAKANAIETHTRSAEGSQETAWG
jgi:hypothetical protein